jgi:hypothetical protein
MGEAAFWLDLDKIDLSKLVVFEMMLLDKVVDALHRIAFETIKRVLEIEPQLTSSRLRARVPFMPEATWERLSEGLIATGLPE